MLKLVLFFYSEAEQSNRENRRRGNKENKKGKKDKNGRGGHDEEDQSTRKSSNVNFFFWWKLECSVCLQSVQSAVFGFKGTLQNWFLLTNSCWQSRHLM